MEMGLTLPESMSAMRRWNFLIPGGFDGGIVRFDERTREGGAFRDGQGKSFFQKFGGFLGHTLIITRNMVMKARPATRGLRE